MTVHHDRRVAAPVGRGSVRRQLSSRYRRSVRLVALGAAVPGAGLIRTPARKAGWAILLAFVLSVASVAYLVVSRGVKDFGLYLLSHPDLLEVAGLLLGAAGLVWCASIVATAVAARPEWLDRPRTRVLAMFTTLTVALVGTGTYKGAEYLLVTKDTLVALTSDAKPGGGPNIVVDEPGVDPWRDTPRVNLLIIGSDAGSYRDGTRTDSMVVASIDTKSGRTVLVQIPRSLEKAPLAEDSPLRALYPTGQFGEPKSACVAQMGGEHECLLTHLWRQAEFFQRDNPTAYPGEDSPGRLENRRTIELITGLTIDSQIIVNLKGFESLIDAMGGIDITVKGGGYDGTRPIPIGGKSDGNGGVIGEKGWFEFGRQHMGGYHALWYARARAVDDDTGRQSRQRCVIREMVAQVNPGKLFSKYTELAGIVRDNIWMDIAPDHLPAFVELLERVQKAKLSSLPLTPSMEVYAGNPDYELVRKLVQKAIDPPKKKSKPKPTTTASTETTRSTPTPAVTEEAEVDECA